MTPGARVAAAIEILDEIATGVTAERALGGWARGHRFAGSKDRAAIRDHVFDVMRCWRSFAALGGAETGRGLMIGALRAQGIEAQTLFDGNGYGPTPLTDAERAAGGTPASDDADAVDCPAWLWPSVVGTYGEDAASIMRCLQSRAPVHLRVNLRKATVPQAQRALQAEEIVTHPLSVSPSALHVTDGARRIRGSVCYRDGLVELQDGGSQALSDAVPLEDDQTLLDYCAGGGGKSLAVAARVDGQFFAHDANAKRMNDIPVRAERAGVDLRRISTTEIASLAPFDTVLVDAPCSGSGSWRRDPQAKWNLDVNKLDELCGLQQQILDNASVHVSPGGHLVYATCSILREENHAQIEAFLTRDTQWRVVTEKQRLPSDEGDGFYWAVLTR